MPASTTCTTFPSATFLAAAAVPLPDSEQPAVVMEHCDEDFPMPIITEVVSLAGRASFEAENGFDFAQTTLTLASSDYERFNEPQTNDTVTSFSVTKDTKPSALQYTRNSSSETSLEHRTDHGETPACLTNRGASSQSTQYASKDADTACASLAESSLPSFLQNASSSSASVPRQRYSSKHKGLKIGGGLSTRKSAAGSAVVKGFEPRVLKNSTDRKYERRAPSNSAATISQLFLVPLSINRMPVPLSAPQVCINQLPASAESSTNAALVSYNMQPSGGSNPTIVLFSPVTETIAPNIQSGQSSLQRRLPSLAPRITEEIRPNVVSQAPLITVPQSILQQGEPVPVVPLVTVPESIRQPGEPVQVPLINQGIRRSAHPPVPMRTAIGRAYQLALEADVRAHAALIAEKIKPPPLVPLVTAASTTVSQYHGSKHQVFPVPHGSAQSASPDKPHLFEAPSESHMKQSGAILGSASRATASSQASNEQPKEAAEKSQQAKGSLENSALSKADNRDGKQKSQFSSGADHSKKAATQSPQAQKVYQTQIWQRNKPAASGGAARQPQNGHALLRQPQAVQGNMQHSSALNGPWERIIVSSDIAPTLTLDEVRKGIETFLMINGVHEKVSKVGSIHLHWDGKDLGTFRFTYSSSGSLLPAQRTTTEEVIVISSDDEQAEEAPKTTTRARPVTSDHEQTNKDAVRTAPAVTSSDDEQAEEAPKTTTRARPVTSDDEQTNKDAVWTTPVVTSSDDEQAEEALKTTTRARPVTSDDEQDEQTNKDAVRTTPVAATAPVKPDGKYLEQIFEPEIVLEECDTQLCMKPFEMSPSDSGDSSSDSERVSENSSDDPTYDPYEELDDISSGDELPDPSSSDESGDATAKSKNHNGLGKSCEQVRENPGGILNAGESSLTYPCSNSSSNARKRKYSGSTTDNESKSNSDESSSAHQLERKNYNSQLRHMRRGSHKVRRRSSRPMTRFTTVKAEPPHRVLLPPCHVELVPIDMTLVVNGSVNLSVIREDELFVADGSAQRLFELTWARLANAISQTHGLVGDW